MQQADNALNPGIHKRRLALHLLAGHGDRQVPLFGAMR
jgi:hypothetical protein